MSDHERPDDPVIAEAERIAREREQAFSALSPAEGDLSDRIDDSFEEVRAFKREVRKYLAGLGLRPDAPDYPASDSDAEGSAEDSRADDE